MIAFWLEKRWVQYTCLAAVLAAMTVYWGFFFDFGYEFDWSILFTENPTYQEHFGLTLIHGLVLTIKISLISSGPS